MTAEQELLAALGENQGAALRALAADDLYTLQVLAREEARLMDFLRAVWSMQAGKL